jgi:hypothetical protein
MKIEKANNLEVNFISRAMVDDLDKLDRKKLWMMEADAVVETWISSDGETIARRYASGWQELRGYRSGSGSSTITYPFPFANSHYGVTLCNMGAGYAYMTSTTTTTVTIATSGTSTGVIWSARGMGAN